MRCEPAKTSAAAGCPMLAGRALLDLVYLSLLPSGSSLCCPPHMAHALSLERGGGRKRKLLVLGRAMNPAAAYRADLAGVVSRARLRDKDGWGSEQCEQLIDSRSVIMTIFSLSPSPLFPVANYYSSPRKASPPRRTLIRHAASTPHHESCTVLEY